MVDRSTNFDGMTVNERLFVSGRLSQFDDAVARRDPSTVARLLQEVDVDEKSISEMLRQMGIAK
jgi:hypothetical protein